MSTKEQKIQGRKAELPALCFLNLSTHFYVWVTVWVRRLTHILTHTVSAKKARKIPEIIRFQGFSGAAGRIRTADLILTKWLKAPKVLLFSAFGVFLFQRCVVFRAFHSIVSIRSFPRVCHGVGQTENTGRISCRMPVFSSCRFAQVTRVTSSTKWRSFFAK